VINAEAQMVAATSTGTLPLKGEKRRHDGWWACDGTRRQSKALRRLPERVSRTYLKFWEDTFPELNLPS
jgi:hypothetical protein